MDDVLEFRRDSFLVTADATRLDLDAACTLLNATYWAKGRSRELIERSFRHSLCFSLFDGERQIGLMRVITDYAVFAYLCDVVIDPAYRGRGLGQWMLSCVLAYPDLRGLRRWCLLTSDAQTFYQKAGFGYIDDPKRYMERMQSEL